MCPIEVHVGQTGRLGCFGTTCRTSTRSGPLIYVTQYCFRAGKKAFGMDFRRILVEKTSKSDLRAAEGRPEGRL